jgi:hypothetical protein
MSPRFRIRFAALLSLPTPRYRLAVKLFVVVGYERVLFVTRP